MKIYDSWEKAYKWPFGALRRGETCRFTIHLPLDMKPDFEPVLVLFRDGFKERFASMLLTEETEEYRAYTAEFCPSYYGLVRYYFSFTVGGERKYIKKINASEGALSEGGLWQLTIYDERYETPEFVKGGIIYQIFPDRFCKGGEPSEIPYGRVQREDWGGTPYYRPDENGHVWNNDYFGGDLKGIISKLDYIASLGVNVIYLNPIFEAHENHRYNTANYRKIDPFLGTNEDFKTLCEEAKKFGIRIILDGVFSHTGADSIYFNKFGRYDTVGAYNSKDSEYYDWYTFINFPDEYEAWWGIDTLPNVWENNEKYTEYICGEGGVLDYWISMGAAGYRLDVADELPDQFLENLNRAVKRNGSDKLIIGEVWEDASNKESYGVKRRYLQGQQLDSVMNYPFREAILDYVSGHDARLFRDRVCTILENYPKPSIETLMNFVSTHDIERAINRLGGESCEGKSKDWQAERYLTPEEYEKGKTLLKEAMVLQYFLPGVPSIYYGDEVGLQGYKDPFNRRCFPWGHEDTELLEYVRELGAIRRSMDFLARADLRFFLLEPDALIFSRFSRDEKKAIIVTMNLSSEERRYAENPDVKRLYTNYRFIKGNTTANELIMPPHSYAVCYIENRR